MHAIIQNMGLFLEGPWYSTIAAIPGLFSRGVGPFDLYKVYGVVEKLDPELATADIISNLAVAVGLPEHLAEVREIDVTIGMIKNLIASKTIRPALITVARSVSDGFPPSEDLPRIEGPLMNALREVLDVSIVQYDDI